MNTIGRSSDYRYSTGSLDTVRLTEVSASDSTKQTEAPKSKGGFFSGIVALFSFSSKETSEQQSAQKKTWFQSISDFFSWLGGGSSKTSSGLKGAKANWVEKASDEASQLATGLANASSEQNSPKLFSQSARKNYGQHSNSPNAPQNKESQRLQDELEATNTNDETALNRYSDFGSRGSFVGSSDTKKKETQPQLSSNKSALGSTVRAMQENVNKANNVKNKTEDMKNAASDLNATTKELLAQQRAKNDAWDATLDTLTGGVYSKFTKRVKKAG